MGFNVPKREFSDPKIVLFLKNVVFTPLHGSENPAFTNPQSSENSIPILSKNLTRHPVFSLEDPPELIPISDHRHDRCHEKAEWGHLIFPIKKLSRSVTVTRKHIPDLNLILHPNSWKSYFLIVPYPIPSFTHDNAKGTSRKRDIPSYSFLHKNPIT